MQYSISKKTTRVFWLEGGSVEHVSFSETEGRWGSNYAHSEMGFYDSPEPPMPKDVFRAIKLMWGHYGNHHSSGLAWEIYDVSSPKGQGEGDGIPTKRTSPSPSNSAAYPVSVGEHKHR